MNIEEYINKKELKERLCGDFNLFKELAELFISNMPQHISEIENAITNKNGSEIEKSAHTIKGAVSNFSAERVYASALKLEKIGKHNEMDKADEAFYHLKDEIACLIEAMQLIIRQKSL